MASLRLNVFSKLLERDSPHCFIFKTTEDSLTVTELKDSIYSGHYRRDFDKKDIGLAEVRLLFVPVNDPLLFEPRNTLPERVDEFLNSGKASLPSGVDSLSDLLAPHSTGGPKHVDIILQITPHITKEPPTDAHPPRIIETARLTAVRHARSAGAPSRVAKQASEFAKQQDEYPLYNGRPLSLRAPALDLYHPAFADLKDKLKPENLANVEPKPLYLRTTLKLQVAASAIYETEKLRVQEMQGPLEDLLGVTFGKERLTESRVEGDGQAVVEVIGGTVWALFVAKEDKVELGTGDPGLQAGLVYRKHVLEKAYEHIRNASSCPCILIAIAGAHICIFGAVLGPIPIVQPITDYIDLSMHFPTAARTAFLARMFAAVRDAVGVLRREYKALTPKDTPDDRCNFPRPSYIGLRDGDRAIIDRLAYDDWLDYPGRDPKDFQRAIFCGRLGNRAVVIKFSETYCQEAHEFLAGIGLAPALHLCVRVKGGFYMSVMDLVEGESAHVRYMDREVPAAVMADVERGIEFLHAHDLVFGDLRRPNILVVPTTASSGPAAPAAGVASERAFLIDFDWAGRVGQARYPCDINTSGLIRWPTGVEGGEIMTQEHDLVMLGFVATGKVTE